MDVFFTVDRLRRLQLQWGTPPNTSKFSAE